uniref:Uncharacterized protein n=1 Tax=Arundo donax TaxID=35708 RepID=A0A0A9BMQ5_ARUDO
MATMWDSCCISKAYDYDLFKLK